MWWLIVQKGDIHRTNKRIAEWSKGYGYTQWEYDYLISVNENPKKGIGHVVFVEADHCRQAQNRLQEIGIQRHSQRYGKIRETPLGPLQAFSNNIQTVGAPTRTTYIHFLDGWFFPIHGLHPLLVQDLIRIHEAK